MSAASSVSVGIGSVDTIVDLSHPWVGLAPFTEAQRRYFYGRDEETEKLLRAVKRRATLAVLFGESGLGKTSLLHAALFPKLREQGYLPISIRLDHSYEAPAPAAQVKRALAKALADAGSGEAAPGEDETLWEYFHRLPDGGGEPKSVAARAVLVFDQFEEIFTRGGDPRRRPGIDAFLVELADLVENRAPAALQKVLAEDPDATERYNFALLEHRVVLSLREDFLPQLESLRERMPSVTENRMRLLRMNGRQASDAVAIPGEKVVTREVALEIVRFVAASRYTTAADADLETLVVEPSLLSLVCRELNQRRIDAALPEITAELLQGSSQRILEDFYETRLKAQPPAVRAFVEEELLTDSGYRENIAVDRAQRMIEERGAPRACLQTLVERRLLHVVEGAQGPRVELAHDLLIDVVKSSRNKRRQAEALKQAAEREEEVRQRLWHSRRRLALAIGLAGFFAVVSTLAAIGWLKAREEIENSKRMSQDLSTQTKAKAVVDAELGKKTKELNDFLVRAEIERKEVIASTERAKALEADAESKSYLADLRLAERALQLGQFDRALTLLDSNQPTTTERDYRSTFEWRYLNGLKNGLTTDLPGHRTVIDAVDWSPDGKLIAAADRDGQLTLWDAERGYLASLYLSSLPEHQNAVNAMSFSPDGRLLASCDWDGLVCVFDLRDRQASFAFRLEGGAGCLAFDGGSRWLAVGGHNRPDIFLYDLAAINREAPRARLQLAGHAATVRCIAFRPDSQQLELASLGDDRSIRLWKASLSDASDAAKAVDAAKAAKAANAESYTSETIGDRDGESPTSGRDLFHLDYTQDGQRLLALGSSAMFVWRVADKQFLGAAGFQSALGVRFEQSRDGTRIAIGAIDGRVLIFDAAGLVDLEQKLWKPSLELTAHSSLVGDAAFSPDGRKIVSGSFGGKLRISEVARSTQSSDLVRSFPTSVSGNVRVAFRNSGAQAVAYGKQLEVRDAATGRRLPPLGGIVESFNGQFKGSALNADGSQLAFGVSDGTLRIADAYSGAFLKRLPASGAAVHKAPITKVEFSPDGAWLASATDSGSIVLWALVVGEPIASFDTGQKSVKFLAFDSASKQLAVVVSDRTEIYSIPDCRKLVDVKNEDLESERPWSATFHPLRPLFAVGTFSGSASLWETGGYERQDETFARGPVVSGAWNADGSRFAAGSSGEVTLLGLSGDQRSWQDLLTLPLEGAQAWGVAFDLSGQRLGVTAEQRIWFFDAALLSDELALADWFSLYVRGCLRLHLGHWALAEDAFTSAVSLQGNDPYLWHNRGRARCFREDYAAAIDDFSEAERLVPGDGAIALSRHIALLLEGDVEAAEVAYRQAVEHSHGAVTLSPGVRWLDRRSAADRAPGAWEGAVGDLTRLLDGEGASERVSRRSLYRARGVAQAALGRYEPAAGDFRAALSAGAPPGEKASDESDLKLGLARALCEVIETRGEAIDFCSAALAAVENDPDRDSLRRDLLYLRATSRRLQGGAAIASDRALAARLAAPAAADLASAGELAPSSWIYPAERAHALSLAGDMAGAAAAFTAARGLVSETDPEALYGLARIGHDIGWNSVDGEPEGLTAAIEVAERVVEIVGVLTALRVTGKEIDATWQAYDLLGYLHASAGDDLKERGEHDAARDNLRLAADAYLSAVAKLEDGKVRPEAREILGSLVRVLGRAADMKMDLREVEPALEIETRRLKLLAEAPFLSTDAKQKESYASGKGRMAWKYLFNRRPKEAVAAAEEGLSISTSQSWIAVNQAHGYLLDGQFDKAEAIYRSRANELLGDGRRFRDGVLDDFREFREFGIEHPDMAKIEALYAEPPSP